MREKTANALSEIRDSRVVEPFIAVLKDENKWVRSEVAQTLGKIKDPRAVEHLIKAYNGAPDTYNYPDAKRYIVKILGGIGDPGAVEFFISILKNMKHLKRRLSGTAAESLGKIKDPRAIDPLIEA